MKKYLQLYAEQFNTDYRNRETLAGSAHLPYQNGAILATPLAQELEGGWVEKTVDGMQTYIAKNHASLSYWLTNLFEGPGNLEIPYLGSPTSWIERLAGKDGDGKFQWDVGPGDFYHKSLNNLRSKYVTKLRSAGFDSSQGYKELQRFAATDNGAAFLSAVIYNEFRKEWGLFFQDASTREVADVYSAYFRSGPETFRLTYVNRIRKDYPDKADEILEPHLGYWLTLNQLSTELKPQGSIDDWFTRHAQLEKELDPESYENRQKLRNELVRKSFRKIRDELIREQLKIREQQSQTD